MTQLEVRRDTQFITIAAMAYFMSRKRKLERKVLFYRNVLRTATLKHLWTLLSLTLFFKAIVSKLYLPNKITQLQKWTFGLRSRCSSLAFVLYFLSGSLSYAIISLSYATCTCISNKEQLTINIRSVDKELEAHEDFFYNIRHIDGETNSVSYKRCGIKTTLSSLVKCRGQCYEGVSNMMGHKTSTKGLSYSLS